MVKSETAPGGSGVTSMSYPLSEQAHHLIANWCRGNTLILGTSFPIHVDQSATMLERIAGAPSLTIALSELVFEHLPEVHEGISYIGLRPRGQLAMTFDRQTIRKLRARHFTTIVILYHDIQFLRNRRAETMALLCPAQHYLLINIENRIQHCTYTQLLRKFLLGSIGGSETARLTFFAWLTMIRIVSIGTRIGRKILLSRWT